MLTCCSGRAPRAWYISRQAEGGCFCLATVSVFLCPGAARPSCMQVTAARSPSLSRKRACRFLATLPSDCRCLSTRQRVRYRLFSRQRPRVYKSVCFILCDRLPYTAYVVSPALAWRLYPVPIVSHCQSCEYNCRRPC